MPIRGNSTTTPFDRVQRREGLGVARGEPSGRGARRALSKQDERELRQILANEQDYIDHPALHEKNAERKIFDDAPDVRKPDASWYHPVMDDFVSTRNRLPKVTDQVILTGAEEVVLFLQFNYARFRVSELQIQVWDRPDRRPTEAQARELLKWNRKAEQMREQIAETNLALVLAMAKRTRMSEVDFADLVSEGNMALLRAIDKFDCSRGFKFSTYACRAILKAFSRHGMKVSKYNQRFPTEFDPALEKSGYVDDKRVEYQKDAASEVRRIVYENHADLTDIERTVIEHRFRLQSPEDASKPLTLEQVGQIIGVTKERVRQIQNKALAKIRTELEDNFLNGNRLRAGANGRDDILQSFLLN
ncbi:MAG: sigma-70 family RNA polymerase sigma factor [Phycisphaerales bacterium]